MLNFGLLFQNKNRAKVVVTAEIIGDAMDSCIYYFYQLPSIIRLTVIFGLISSSALIFQGYNQKHKKINTREIKAKLKEEGYTPVVIAYNPPESFGNRKLKETLQVIEEYLQRYSMSLPLGTLDDFVYSLFCAGYYSTLQEIEQYRIQQKNKQRIMYDKLQDSVGEYKYLGNYVKPYLNICTSTVVKIRDLERQASTSYRVYDALEKMGNNIRSDAQESDDEFLIWPVVSVEKINREYRTSKWYLNKLGEHLKNKFADSDRDDYILKFSCSEVKNDVTFECKLEITEKIQDITDKITKPSVTTYEFDISIIFSEKDKSIADLNHFLSKIESNEFLLVRRISLQKYGITLPKLNYLNWTSSSEIAFDKATNRIVRFDESNPNHKFRCYPCFDRFYYAHNERDMNMQLLCLKINKKLENYSLTTLDTHIIYESKLNPFTSIRYQYVLTQQNEWQIANKLTKYRRVFEQNEWKTEKINNKNGEVQNLTIGVLNNSDRWLEFFHNSYMSFPNSQKAKVTIGNEGQRVTKAYYIWAYSQEMYKKYLGIASFFECCIASFFECLIISPSGESISRYFEMNPDEPVYPFQKIFPQQDKLEDQQISLIKENEKKEQIEEKEKIEEDLPTAKNNSIADYKSYNSRTRFNSITGINIDISNIY